MVTYLLLRDNKQCGPFALDELKAKGLKAYDLVWIEGKSAAWRYPSEIEELKAFAPAVEEQPWDRFYKKAGATEQVSSSPAPVAEKEISGIVKELPRTDREIPRVEKEMPRVAATRPSVVPGEPSTVPGKRIIYVTLPAGNRNGASRDQVVPLVAEQPAAKDRVVSQAAAVPVTNDRVAPEPQANDKAGSYSTYGITGYAMVEAESVPSEWPPRRVRTSGSRRRILRPLAITATVLALLAAGVFIGLNLNKDNLFAFGQRTAPVKAVSEPVRQLADHKTEIPATDNPLAGSGSGSGLAADAVPGAAAGGVSGTGSIVPGASSGNVAGALPGKVIAASDAGNRILSTGAAGPVVPGQRNTVGTATDNGLTIKSKKAILADNRKDKTLAEQKPVAELAAGAESAEKDSSGLNTSSVQQRETVRRADVNPEREAFRSNIASLVSVTGSNYNVGTFGGISDLQLTVTNRSAFSLDLVVVEVQYVQANKKIYKKENLNFHDIRAGSALMLEAPKTSRGIKVAYRIMLINTKDGLSYSSL